MDYQAAKSPSIERLYSSIRTSTLTQLAALLFGIAVGVGFAWVFFGNPPTLDRVFTVAAGVFGTATTAIIDALTPQKSRRRHLAVYLIGFAGAFIVMAYFILTGRIEAAPPAATPAPTPTLSSSPSPS
jgi:phage shock protein PspC (stress-responsive transcriptional regulator)